MKLVYNFDGSAIPMWVQLLFWLLYMLISVYTFRKLFFQYQQNENCMDIRGLFTVFFMLYAVFYCVNDDYFNYRDWIFGRNFDFWGKEYIYIPIIYFCRLLPISYPYEIFRLIVWGGGILIVYHTYRLYQGLLLPVLALLLLFVFYAGTFCYARASLGMAVYFFGVAFYLLHDRKTLKLLGIGIALLSFFFHHEMIIGIAVLPCIFIPFERKNFIILSLFMVLIAVFALSYVSSYLQFLDQMFDNNELSSKVETMSEKGQGVFRLSTLVKYLNYFYPFFLLMKTFWEEEPPRSVIGMFRITYGILMASVIFMVVFGLRSVFTYRIMYISMIPMSLLIGYGYCHRYFTRNEFLIMMIFTLLASSIRFINAQ